MQIRTMRIEDIPVVHTFPPDDWHSDFGKILRLHFNEPYFHPIVTVNSDDRIVGTAFGVLFNRSVWLGYIIVPECHRRQGIGTLMTQYLVDLGKSEGVLSAQLFATTLGQPVYEKVGFSLCGRYHYCEGDIIAGPPPNHRYIHEIEPEDFKAICKMDRELTGEDRSPFLKKLGLQGWKYCDPDGMKGYFFPQWDNGLIVARTEEAGLNLLHLKHHLSQIASVIPEQNRKAIDYLAQYGYKKTKSIPRMICGERVNWKAENIYSRGTAYTG